MFFFINLRKQFRCTATSNLFNPTKQPLQSQLSVPLTQQTATSITTRSPFHHQSNHISLNKSPYNPQTFINHPIFAILFICPQTQNKRAKTRPFVSFSPFMLHKFTLTIAFSICFPIFYPCKCTRKTLRKQ